LENKCGANQIIAGLKFMGCLVFAGRFLQIHGSLQKRPASMDLWNSLSFAGLFSQMKVEPIKSLQVADLWVVSSLQVSLANKSGANQIITGLRLMGYLTLQVSFYKYMVLFKSDLQVWTYGKPYLFQVSFRK